MDKRSHIRDSRINTKIGGGRARIEMGSTGRAQDEVLNDAKDTALVLRSGALPGGSSLEVS